MIIINITIHMINHQVAQLACSHYILTYYQVAQLAGYIAEHTAY